MTIEDSYNFRRISDNVTTSGVVGAERLTSLAAAGYDAVINLLPDASEYAVADEADIVNGQGVDYVYIPVDWADPTQSDLGVFIAAMEVHEGRRVHVHCAANFRVTAFYGLYAEQKGLCSQTEADDLIAGVWDPDTHPQWAEFIAAQRQR